MIPSIMAMSSSFVDVNIIYADNQHSWMVPANSIQSITPLVSTEEHDNLQSEDGYIVLFDEQKNGCSLFQIVLGLDEMRNITVISAKKPQSVRVRISELKDVMESDAQQESTYAFQLVNYAQQVLQVPSFIKLGIEQS